MFPQQGPPIPQGPPAPQAAAPESGLPVPNNSQPKGIASEAANAVVKAANLEPYAPANVPGPSDQLMPAPPLDANLGAPLPEAPAINAPIAPAPVTNAYPAPGGVRFSNGAQPASLDAFMSPPATEPAAPIESPAPQAAPVLQEITSPTPQAPQTERPDFGNMATASEASQTETFRAGYLAPKGSEAEQIENVHTAFEQLLDPKLVEATQGMSVDELGFQARVLALKAEFENKQ